MSRNWTSLALWGAPWGFVVATGCALFGSGPDLQRAKGYSVKAPSSWENVEKAESDRAFRLPSGGLATVTSSCNRNSDAPLETLTKHLMLGARHVNILEQKRENVDGVAGLKTKVKATFEGKPINLVLFVLAKEDCIFDFSMMSPKEITSGDDSDFMKLVQSFNYGKR